MAGFKGQIPYRVFDKDQQPGTHSAIADNKRLSEVLAYAMELREAASPKMPRAGKPQTRYEPTGQEESGRKSLLDRRSNLRAGEADAAQAAE